MRQDEPIVDFNFFKIPPFVYTLLNNFIVFMATHRRDLPHPDLRGNISWV